MTIFNVYIETANETFFIESFENKEAAIEKADNPGPAYRSVYNDASVVVRSPEVDEPVYSTSL